MCLVFELLGSCCHRCRCRCSCCFSRLSTCTHTHISCTLLQALFRLLLSVLLFDMCVVCCASEWASVSVHCTRASTFKQIRRFSQSLRISQAELLIWHPLFVCLSIWRCVCVCACAVECSKFEYGMCVCVRLDLYGMNWMHTNGVIPLTCSSFYADVCHLCVCLRHF